MHEKWGREERDRYAVAATGASQISSPRVRACVCVYLINASEGDLSAAYLLFWYAPAVKPCYAAICLRSNIMRPQDASGDKRSAV